MARIKINFKTIRLNEPMMLFWSLIPLILLIVTTNYVFNSKADVLGLSTDIVKVEKFNNDGNFDEIKNKNSTFKTGRNGLITILFSGATKNQFETAYPLLEKENMVAVVSAPTLEINKIESKMTWLDLNLLQHQGWEIISQSREQICDTSKLKDLETVISEVKGSKDELSEMGLYVNTYIAPCGVSTPEVVGAVKTNYKGFINFGTSYNSPNQSNRYGLITKSVNNKVSIEEIKGWIKDVKETGQWLIISIPEINSVMSDYSVDSIYLEQIVNEVKLSKVQTATIGQVLKY